MIKTTQIVIFAFIATLAIARADKEDSPGEGKSQGPGQTQQQEDVENPLESILKLMGETENRLIEINVDSYLLEGQKQIVEAMRFEDKTTNALDRLIASIEDSQSSSGQSSSNQQKQQQQQKAEQKGNRGLSQEELDKKEEEKRKKAQKRQSDKKVSPPKKDKQRTETASGTNEEGSVKEDRNSGSGNWGQLPSKLHQDAANARNIPPPTRWQKLIHRYRTKLSKTDD